MEQHNDTQHIHIPFTGRFSYSRAELIADGAVHAVGIVLAIAAGAALLAMALPHAAPGEYVAAAFFVVSLLTVLTISMVYNLLPVSPTKWVLRRFDHAGIYLLIAATYTPFLAQLQNRMVAIPMIAVVWLAALCGMGIKLFLPGRFDRLAIVFYLAIGWSGAVIARPLIHELPATTLALLLAGGIAYSTGVVFFVWTRLRFQSAVWHAFVVTGAGLHFAALVETIVLNRI